MGSRISLTHSRGGFRTARAWSPNRTMSTLQSTSLSPLGLHARRPGTRAPISNFLACSVLLAIRRPLRARLTSQEHCEASLLTEGSYADTYARSWVANLCTSSVRGASTGLGAGPELTYHGGRESAPGKFQRSLKSPSISRARLPGTRFSILRFLIGAGYAWPLRNAGCCTSAPTAERIELYHG